MSSLHFQNFDQIQFLIKDYGYQEEIDLKEWSDLPQFQWVNPEIFFLSILIYRDGIKNRENLKRKGYLNSLINRYNDIVSLIKGDQGEQKYIITIVIRYLILMIDFN